ncbi:MarR family winged helix-turn-helix transcriptional regulator [Geodermatophilus sp. URMC 60]
MAGARPGDLRVLDEALVRLRRLWAASRAHVVDDLGRRVEMSSVLVVEACARAEPGTAEVTVGDVAAFLDVEPSTASRMVERAAAAGLVLRVASTVNGRRVALRITEAGRELRARATAARLGWLGGVVADWPGEEVHALATALTRFADAVAATPASAGGGRGAPPRT